MNEWELFWRWARLFKRRVIAWLLLYLLVLALAVSGCLVALEVIGKAGAPPARAPFRGQEDAGAWHRVEERDMVVTAYTCGPESTGKGPLHPAYRISTSGYIIPRHARVVAAPPEIPFGAVIAVPGYGWAPVVDRGGAIVGDRLDVHIEDVAEALEWGVKRLKVKIIYPAEGRP